MEYLFLCQDINSGENMEISKVIRLLQEQENEFLDKYVDYEGIKEAYETAIDAVSKLVPVEPFKKDEHHYYCGWCDKRIRLKHKPSYCSKCGTKIKWSKVIT